MTETLVAVNPTPKDPTDPPSAAELAAAGELVRRARVQPIMSDRFLWGPARDRGCPEFGGTSVAVR
jgi:hypothetical protein